MVISRQYCKDSLYERKPWTTLEIFYVHFEKKFLVNVSVRRWQIRIYLLPLRDVVLHFSPLNRIFGNWEYITASLDGVLRLYRWCTNYHTLKGSSWRAISHAIRKLSRLLGITEHGTSFVYPLWMAPPMAVGVLWVAPYCNALKLFPLQLPTTCQKARFQHCPELARSTHDFVWLIF